MARCLFEQLRINNSKRGHLEHGEPKVISIFIIITIAGFIFSGLLHLLMMFRIYSPPRELMIVIIIGAALSIYAAIFISKQVCDQANIKDFRRKVMLSVCPRWILGLTGLLIMYAFAGLLYSLFKKYFGNTALASGSTVGDSYGFSGHWMALYALAFTILYSCKKYKSGPNNPNLHS